MNIIHENRRRSASNDPFARAVLWLLCFVSPREKCQYSEFVLSTFSCISTEYFEIVPISPYSVKMQENTDQKKLRIPTLFTQCVFWLVLLFAAQYQFILSQHWKSNREKRQILLGMRGSINPQNVWEYFSTIFWVVLKVRGGGLGCIIPTISLLPFGSSLDNYSTTT